MSPLSNSRLFPGGLFRSETESAASTAANFRRTILFNLAQPTFFGTFSLKKNSYNARSAKDWITSQTYHIVVYQIKVILEIRGRLKCRTFSRFEPRSGRISNPHAKFAPHDFAYPHLGLDQTVLNYKKSSNEFRSKSLRLPGAGPDSSRTLCQNSFLRV